MAEQYIYIANLGQFPYDDTDYVQEEATDPSDPTYYPQDLETKDATHTSGQHYVATAPTKDQHVVRYFDAKDALTEHLHPFLLMGA